MSGTIPCLINTEHPEKAANESAFRRRMATLKEPPHTQFSRLLASRQTWTFNHIHCCSRAQARRARSREMAIPCSSTSSCLSSYDMAQNKTTGSI